MRFVFAGLLCGALSACGSINSGPDSSLDSDRDFSKIIINETLSTERLKGFATSQNLPMVTRNQVIQARMAEIDVLYFKYENQISRDIRSGNFGFSLAGIAFGTAGSVAGARASQDLSALSAALAGGKAAYERDVLMDQSLQAFIAQMRANRAAVKATIISRFGQSTSVYTLQLALSDLAEYEQAGTLASALSGITQSAQDAEKTQNEALEKEERAFFRTRAANIAPQAQSIIGWINSAPNDEARQARMNATGECHNAANRESMGSEQNSSVGFFLADSGAYPAVVTQVVDCLRTKGFTPG